MILNSERLAEEIRERLGEWSRQVCLYPENLTGSRKASAVLFLLSQCTPGRGPEGEPCVIFNKRSKQVRQAGDLCFPGGSLDHRIDALAAKMIGLPFFPLGRWTYWKKWQAHRKEEASRLALLLAAGLRESLEEMRLNPLGTEFVGPLPANALQSFEKVIYPLVVWIKNQKRFFPNWEVEKVVAIPLRDFLNPKKYVRYRMHFESYSGPHFDSVQDFPGFLHEEGSDREVLWGATYRIVMTFLEIVFGFLQPDLRDLPVIEDCRDEGYFNGYKSGPSGAVPDFPGHGKSGSGSAAPAKTVPEADR
jgi:hypothetical protein